jgi:hypothetical protein
MQEKTSKRGRPSYQDGENPNITVIKDPKIEPFYIVKDQHTFTLFEKSKATRGFAGKEASNKEVENVVGYYTSFKYVLKKIATEKFSRKHKSYESIKDYISEWKSIEDGLKTLLN